MKTYIKAQAASVIGSFADFCVSLIFVEGLRSWYLVGNICGNICGAVVQFFLSRNWAFHAGERRLKQQSLKFILFWSGNILLQSAGVYFFKQWIKLDFMFSKTITSLIVGLTYNYFGQKKYVFV